MKRNGGFTLIELVVVIIIVGILAAMGFTQYTKMVEKGRTAEAKSVLGSLRTAQRARYLEVGSYTAAISDLPVEAPTACTTTHYYSYVCAATGTCTATRCTAGGKTPNAAAASSHNITLSIAGAWGGTAGYY
ncbi:MAG: prepilin-type N-terminal cleavage/methylation domain-containing protein [Candidatus Omnitrophica bacterium]|jgi:prepilin-type N-terminal cleavage/methylation domain-containing protein|nr:prepilin-type N-terminal cleavage/methylation domain-containing protein [Candidatus Omnitrophota bacterium]